MGWITINLRSSCCGTEINSLELYGITLSRQLRSLQRHLTYDKSRLNAEKTAEIKDAKKEYTEARKDRPDINSAKYAEWQAEYSEAKENFEAQKTDIDDYYSGLMEDIETESTDEENFIQEIQTEVEARLQSYREEHSSVKETQSTDIQSSKISLK